MERNRFSKIFAGYGTEIVLLLVCLGYVLLGIAQIVVKQASIIEIIGSGILAFITGLTIAMLMGRKGIISGEAQGEFIATKAEFNKVVDIITPNINYLGKYLDNINAQTYKSRVSAILLPTGFSFENYISGIKREGISKDVIRILKKADRVKKPNLTVLNVLSETDECVGNKYSIGRRKADYQKQVTKKDGITRIVAVLLFAYFGLSMISDISWETVIWSVFQIIFFLGSGMMRYWNAYTFITDEYRQTLIAKTNLLYDFNANINNKEIMQNDKQ